MGDSLLPAGSADCTAILEQLKEIVPEEMQDLVTFEDSLKEDGRHAVHAFIYAPRPSDTLVGLDSDKSAHLKVQASIMMHLRFDGQLGFGGGIVDEHLTGLSVEEGRRKVVEALARELHEEINFDTSKHVIKEEDYLFSTRCPNLVKGPKPFFLHFYGHKISPDQFFEAEKRAMASRDYGREVLGNIRVPLYTMSDKYRGFPAFLRNQFVGTARLELLYALLYYGLKTKEEIQAALASTTPQRLCLAQR